MEREQAKKKKKNERSAKGGGDSVFEFCEVCNRNHDQGRRHKYFPSHARSLSALLAKSQNKISKLRCFLRNPSVLRSEDSGLERFWCVFCGLEVGELDGAFACGNAFYHLASSEHLKNLKDFLLKHGGGMDRVDSFRVMEADLIKWEKACRSLKSAASPLREAPIGVVPNLSKDIQHDIISNNIDNYDKHFISSYSSTSHAVMPLQSLTNKGSRVCHPDIGGATTSGRFPYADASFSVGLQGNMVRQNTHSVGNVAIDSTGIQFMPLGNTGRTFVSQCLSNGVDDQRTDSGKCGVDALQKFSQVSCNFGGSEANVHTGALPPWLEGSDVNKGLDLNNPAIPLDLTRNSRKLNPKRVGAAWAEKRRIELEMEKRGEKVPDNVDANWLPNFGRVWQTGTRKESRKEFEIEKHKSLKDDDQSGLSLKIQPYISKRMRSCPNEDSAVGSQEEIAYIL